MTGRNKNELLEQTHLIHSVRKDGGYGRKISHRFIIGIPDLLLVYPTYVPGIWEMKDMGEWNSNTERAVETTEKQKIELNEFAAACNRGLAPLGTMRAPYTASGVLVTYKARNQRFMTICGPEVETMRKDQFPTILRETGQYYNLGVLFNAYGVQRVLGCP